MPTVTVTRHVHFNAAHRLHSPSLSDEENRRVFGLCNNPNFHGHNYELEVAVEGEVDPVTGFVANLDEVKRYLANQEEHHRVRSFQEEFLAFLKRHNLKYDERYIWD